MSKKTIDAIVILDVSGSMRSVIDEAINALNNFVKEQQEDIESGTDCNFTLTVFDDKVYTVFDKVPVQDVGEIKFEDVWSGGMTAMSDAIGITLSHFTETSDAILMIQTDGQENASREYSREAVKQMIEEFEDRGNTVVFMGSNIDVMATSANFGIKASNSLSFAHDAVAYSDSYGSAISDVTRTFRTQKAAGVVNVDVSVDIDNNRS